MSLRAFIFLYVFQQIKYICYVKKNLAKKENSEKCIIKIKIKKRRRIEQMAIRYRMLLFCMIFYIFLNSKPKLSFVNISNLDFIIFFSFASVLSLIDDSNNLFLLLTNSSKKFKNICC